MDLLRIEGSQTGPIYVRSDALFFLGRASDTQTNVGIVLPGVKGLDVVVEGDIDEVAAMFETNVPSIRIHRVN